MDHPTDKVVTAYINLRDAIDTIKTRHKAELKNLEEQLDMLDEELLKRCNDAGGNISIPGVGRVARRITSNYWTNDWSSLYQIIKEHDAFHLLHQRISNKAMKEFLDNNPDLTPPGLNVDSSYAVTVTRAS
jgi:hypothetical protein